MECACPEISISPTPSLSVSVFFYTVRLALPVFLSLSLFVFRSTFSFLVLSLLRFSALLQETLSDCSFFGFVIISRSTTRCIILVARKFHFRYATRTTKRRSRGGGSVFEFPARVTQTCHAIITSLRRPRRAGMIIRNRFARLRDPCIHNIYLAHGQVILVALIRVANESPGYMVKLFRQIYILTSRLLFANLAASNNAFALVHVLYTQCLRKKKKKNYTLSKCFIDN